MNKVAAILFSILLYAFPSFSMLNNALKFVNNHRAVCLISTAIAVFGSSILCTEYPYADEILEPLVGWSCCPDMSPQEMLNLIDGYTWPSGAGANIATTFLDLLPMSATQVRELLSDSALVWEDTMLTFRNSTECTYLLFFNASCKEYIKFITNVACVD